MITTTFCQPEEGHFYILEKQKGVDSLCNCTAIVPFCRAHFVEGCYDSNLLG